MRALAAGGLSQREIAGRLGINPRTVRRMLAADGPPHYRRRVVGSKVDDVEPVIREVLADWRRSKRRA